MNPNLESNDKMILHVALRQSEVKELSEDMIEELLEIEFFVPTRNFELREKIHIG